MVLTRTMTTTATGVILFLLTFSCSQSSESSLASQPAVDLNDDLAKALDISSVDVICGGARLMVFIGDGEQTGRPDLWSVKSVSASAFAADQERRARAFQFEIDAAAIDLETSFAKNPGCGANNPKDLVFLRIVDPDGRDNSRIQTTRYSGSDKQWAKGDTKSWIYSGGITAGSQAFELNLPQSISNIVWTFATNDADKLATATNLSRHGSVVYDQISYFIKGHGGRASIDGSLRSDAAQLRALTPDLLSTHKLQPLILVDTNGPNGPLTSSLYVPEWSAAPSSADATASAEDQGPTSGFQDREETSGKSFSLSSITSPIHDAGAKEAPEGYFLLGEAATYGTLVGQATGLHPLDLPLGAESRPNLLVLDSCYGGPFARFAFPTAQAAPLAILYSPRSFYFEFLEYKALDLAGYLKLAPYLHGITQSQASADQEILAKLAAGEAKTDKNDDASDGVSSDRLAKAAYKELRVWSNK